MSISGYWIIFFIAFIATLASAILAIIGRNKLVYIIVGSIAAVVGLIIMAVCLDKIHKLRDEEYETRIRMGHDFHGF